MRTWLRKLHTWWHGRPQLVIPFVVINPSRAHVKTWTSEPEESDFLWGLDVDPGLRDSAGTRISPGPGDAEWSEQYNAIKDGHVTYDAEASQVRLVSMLTTCLGKPIRFTGVEPLMKSRHPIR